MSERSRIYLDLEGVVFPFGLPPQNDVDVAKLNLTYWWRPSVLRRLGSLGAEIVLNSDSGELVMQQPGGLQPALDLLAPSRALSVNSPLQKIEALCKDIKASPTSFVRLDDRPLHWRHTKMLNTLCSEELSYLQITPVGQIGLLHSHVDRVEDFLATA